MQMLRLSLCLAFAFGVTASQAAQENFARETEFVLTEELSQEQASADLAEQEQAFAEAQSLATTNLDVMGPNACIDNSDKAIKAILDEVKASQATLNGLDNGAKCKTRDQKRITAAQLQKRTANTEVTAKKGQLKDSESATVTVRGSYTKIKSQCSNFYSTGTWRRAEKKVTHNKAALAKAKQALTDAKSNLVNTIEAARVARFKCKCRIRKELRKALENARKSTAEREKSIVRELMLQCLIKARTDNTGATLRNAAASKCKGQKMPNFYKTNLMGHVQQTSYTKIFDGECNGREIRMYEGKADNKGKNASERVARCAKACITKKSPLSGSWSGFLARGFIVIPTTGRCYCEEADSKTCSRSMNTYDRYDFTGRVIQLKQGLKLHHTPMPKDIADFECKKLLKDKCKGFRISTNCGQGNVALQTYKWSVWDKKYQYECPTGWHWANTGEYFNYLRKNGCYGNNSKSGRKGTAYSSRCGWSGYTFGGVSRTKFRFSDSVNNNKYQHAGNNMGYSHNTDTGVSNFAGIACMKNGVK